MAFRDIIYCGEGGNGGLGQANWREGQSMGERIAIVGGGITGCITALACQENGMDCTIYEMAPTLGGIMKDLQFGDRKFFNGCHYFDRGTPWFEALRPRLDFKFEDFPHKYGGITDLCGEVHIEHDYAQPAFSGVAPVGVQGVPMPEGLFETTSVADRLALMGPQVSRTLLEWAAPYGDLTKFHISTARVMQLHRFYFPDDSEDVIRRKRVDARADDMFGIPRTLLNPDQPIEVGSLPKDSYDLFFAALRDVLVAAGVKIVTGVSANPKLSEAGQLDVFVGGERLNVDKVVWCCNPTGLFLRLGLGRLDAPVTKMYVMAADLEGAKLDAPLYYHGFSNDNPIMRLYAYDVAEPKLVVEAFDTANQDETELSGPAKYAQDWLDAIGVECTVKPVGLAKQRRYQFFTIDDAQRFIAFDNMSFDGSLIGGQWDSYSRDGKIAAILDKLGVAFK